MAIIEAALLRYFGHDMSPAHKRKRALRLSVRWVILDSLSSASDEPQSVVARQLWGGNKR